jgi:zinc/manganese transport system substrate-binding protein
MAWLAALALLLTACADDDGSQPSRTTSDSDSAPVGSDDRELPLVVATTSVLGDVVSTIVGGDAVVEVLMPPGADPHDFEPSARQAARLRDATLVVANGLQLEVGLLGALESARADGASILEVGELIEPLPFGASSHAHDDPPAHDDARDDEALDHGDEALDHGDEDPHFWHDPLRMSEVVPGLVDALVAAAPELDTAELRQRADSFVAELVEVDVEVAAILAEVPEARRYLVTNHDTFGYLAERYGFEVIGTVIPGGDTLAQPSPASLAALVREIEEHDLPAIFAENVVAATLAQALASEAEIEVRVVTLHTDSLGEPGSGADTYVGMLRTNARLIADALNV